MAIIFTPVTMPADLQGQANGKLGPCHLRGVYFPGYGTRDLHHLAADAFECMNVACYAEIGYKLTTVGAYRTYAAQERVFRERYTDTYVPLRNVLTNKRWWQGKTWYKRVRVAPVAAPGTSNHGWGLANDVAIYAAGQIVGITSIAKVWSWVQAHAQEFGRSWEGARPGEPGWEPWHLRYVAGDVVPTRVANMKAWFAAHAPKAA
jgi:LAS superfamily LD-carboxypeptidase LdcB